MENITINKTAETGPSVLSPETLEKMRTEAAQASGFDPDAYISTEAADEGAVFVDEPAGPSIGTIDPTRQEFDISWLNRKQRRTLIKQLGLVVPRFDEKGLDAQAELKRRRKQRKKR